MQPSKYIYIYIYILYRHISVVEVGIRTVNNRAVGYNLNGNFKQKCTALLYDLGKTNQSVSYISLNKI